MGWRSPVIIMVRLAIAHYCEGSQVTLSYEALTPVRYQKTSNYGPWMQSQRFSTGSHCAMVNK
jgi:hypothetical protein